MFSGIQIFYFAFVAACENLSGRGPSILLRKTVLSLKSPTGAFIAALRYANAVPPQTLLMVRT